MILDFALDIGKLLLAAVLGGWIANYFRMKFERSKKAQDWRAEKYEEAYILVSEALEQRDMSSEQAFEKKKKLEKALNLADLYGDKEIKNAARDIVDGYLAQKEWVFYDPLRLLLRDRFRQQMGLEALSDPPLRIEFHKMAKKEDTEEKS